MTDHFYQRSINMPYLTSAFAAGWRHHWWLGLLIAASLAFTLGFACALPFAAFGAVSAMTLPRRDALVLVVALWLINQVIGFAVLHYPWDGMTLAWGAILAGIAVLSTVAALVAAMQGRGLVVTAATSFAAAFVIYEGGLYLISASVMGGTEDFAAAIVVRILEINAAAFVALLAAALLLAVLRLRAGVLGRAATPSLSR
jgi:hypothetical protein